MYISFLSPWQPMKNSPEVELSHVSLRSDSDAEGLEKEHGEEPTDRHDKHEKMPHLYVGEHARWHHERTCR